MAAGFAMDHAWPALVQGLGVDPLTMLRLAGLPDDLLQRKDVTLDTGRFFAMWRALEQLADEPTFPIAVAEAASADVGSPLCFAALCSPDLRTALGRLQKYKQLVAPVKLELHADRRGLALGIRWPLSDEPPPPSLVLFELLYFVKLARDGTRKRLVPVEVISSVPVESVAPYEAWFGCPVRLGDLSTVSFAPEDARRPFLTANDRMWSIFEPDFRKRLAELEGSATTAERVHAVLFEGLPSGQCTVGDVASRLGMSNRTLQRKLSAEGTSFKEVLQDSRLKLARHYLVQTELTASEIGFLLGFEQTSSFFRAFQSWTQRTPEALRREARGG